MSDRLGDYFNKNGEAISFEEYARLRKEGSQYFRVAETTLPNGRWVSTVWLGSDHRFSGDGPPLIFETMVFRKKGAGGESLDQERYATEAEALAGHQAMVERWS